MNSIQIIDNKQKSISYDGLALRCAEIGDAWLALHSQILADAAKYKLAMLDENQSIPESIVVLENALTDLLNPSSTQKSYKVSTIVKNFRKELIDSTPSHLQDVVKSELAPLNGLEKLKISEESVTQSFGNHRFNGIEAYEFIRNKQDEATKLYIKAMNLKESDSAKSVVALYQGDLAVFESWLVSQSIMLNDTHYTLAAIRWALATAALNNLEGLPSVPRKAAKEIRKSLLWAVGPENSKSLVKYLLKF